jgi:hypothetical protein
MPRRIRQSKTIDDDFVQYTQYSPKSRLPEIYQSLKALPHFIPFKPGPIDGPPGPDLPLGFDIDSPGEYLRLYFTEDIIQHLVNCTNLNAERKRLKEGPSRP